MKFLQYFLSPRSGVLVFFLLLGGCGGSDSVDSVVDVNEVPNNTPPPATTKSIEGGGIISRFGAGFRSVTVNAKTFDTTSASLTVTINGQAATLQDLNVGDSVIVLASTDDDGVTSVADSIAADSLVEGPITAGSLDAANQTFMVLGQTVVVQSGTLFDDDIMPSSFEGLSDGDFVEVYGTVNADGQIIASRIEDNDPNEFEINGIISNLDAATFTFSIGNQVVDYSSATLDDFSANGTHEWGLRRSGGHDVGA